MTESDWNELEIAPKSVVMQAARHFAQVLAETKEFQAFEQAYYQFRHDAETQNAILAYQQKQSSLKALLMLNAVSDADRKELQTLHDKFYQKPSVHQYINSQEALANICQELGDQLSKAIGLDYGSSCRTGGCCG